MCVQCRRKRSDIYQAARFIEAQNRLDEERRLEQVRQQAEAHAQAKRERAAVAHAAQVAEAAFQEGQRRAEREAAEQRTRAEEAARSAAEAAAERAAKEREILTTALAITGSTAGSPVEAAFSAGMLITEIRQLAEELVQDFRLARANKERAERTAGAVGAGTGMGALANAAYHGNPWVSLGLLVVAICAPSAAKEYKEEQLNLFVNKWKQRLEALGPDRTRLLQLVFSLHYPEFGAVDFPQELA